MIFRKAEKEDFYKIRSLYWNLIDQEQNDLSFPHRKKGIHPSGEMIQTALIQDNCIRTKSWQVSQTSTDLQFCELPKKSPLNKF